MLKTIIAASTIMIAAPALAGALWKDFDDAVATVNRLSHQQLAKCEMEAQQYGDEHPLDVSGIVA